MADSVRSCSNDTSSTEVTGGYDAEFEPALDPKYICPVCLAALRSPLQTKCGHRFCKMCMQKIIGPRPYTKCPVDKTWLNVKSDIFDDVAFEREILSMTVLCSNVRSGCEWRGDLRNLQSHSDTCLFAKLVCPNGCEEQYLRGKTEEHLGDCPLHLLDCTHCSESFIRKDEMNHKLIRCPKYPIECAECGHRGILREQMGKHIDVEEGDCPSSVVPCTFKAVGCDQKIKRCDLPAHNKDELSNHLHLVLAQSLTYKAQLKEQSEAMEVCHEQCHQLKSSFEQLNRNLNEKDKLLNQQVERISLLENTNYNGHLHWKIDLKSHMCRNNSTTCIVSPAFYTSQPGYKLCARLETDGHVTRNSTYTSLFIVLQKGDYDDQLHFPFSTTCKVTLFDQVKNTHERSDFTTIITCSNMSRAGMGNTRDQFRGRLKFMQTDLLTSSRFCNDGVVFVQINVEFTPL
ncbi:TNF receptor-associated factor 6-like [Asterias amurensis]|uniref:TNF receptor-associated factor 6-like n=1 Tax=Asterias amurensis TaxID=7602 RepID=UPI003AB28A63